MSANDFEGAIEKCMAMIEELPPEERAQLLDLVAETRARHKCLQECVNGAMDALDDWRLHEKYSLFDQEARLREMKQAQQRKDADENE